MNIKYIGILYGINDEDICKIKQKNIKIERKLYSNIELINKYDSIKINNNLLFRFDTIKGKNICYEITYEKNYDIGKTDEEIQNEIFEIYRYCKETIQFINMYLGKSILLDYANTYVDNKINSTFSDNSGGTYEEHSFEKYICEEINQEEKEYFLQNFVELFQNMKKNEYLMLINEIYDSNLYTSNFRMLFINFTTCLEILLVAGKSEIVYKIARGIAVLLSTSKEEGNQFFEQMKDLYDMRSKLIHEGKYDDKKFIKKYKIEPIIALKNITNKAVRKAIKLNMNKKELILLINESGYGELEKI